MSDQRETSPVRLKQITFGELAEGARFVTIDKWYLKTGPHHFEDGPNTWRCEDDGLVVEIVDEPAGEAEILTPAEMVEAWRGLLADGHRVSMDTSYLDHQQVWCCIDCDGKVCPENEAVEVDPLRAFSLAYAAYKKGQGP